MKISLGFIFIFVISSVAIIDSLWIREKIEDEDEVMTLEDFLGNGNWVSNSRGPRSLYRGLEVETDFLLDYAESSYDDFEYDYDIL